MKGLRQALSTYIQHVKQEKNIILGSFWGQGHLYTHLEAKTEKGSIDMFIFKIKREQAQFTTKIPHRRYMYTYFTI